MGRCPRTAAGRRVCAREELRDNWMNRAPSGIAARSALAAGLLLSLLAAFLPGRVAASALTSEIVSGLQWRSGAAGTSVAFATWRHRALDVLVLYVPHRAGDGDVAPTSRARPSRSSARWTPQTVVGLAMGARLGEKGSSPPAPWARSTPTTASSAGSWCWTAPARRWCGSASSRTWLDRRIPGASTAPTRSPTGSAASGARRRR